MFRGHLTLPKHEIVDCGAFYEVTFFCVSPGDRLGDFFYSLNAAAQREPALLAIRWSRLLAVLLCQFLPQQGHIGWSPTQGLVESSGVLPYFDD